MIFELLTSIGVTITTTMLSILPALPATPSWINDTIDPFIESLTIPIQFVSYILTPQITIGMTVIGIAIFNFERIYQFTMWLLRKLPLPIN